MSHAVTSREEVLAEVQKLINYFTRHGCDIDYAAQLDLEELFWLKRFLLDYYGADPGQPVDHRKEAHRRNYSSRYDALNYVASGVPIPETLDTLTPEKLTSLREQAERHSKLRLV